MISDNIPQPMDDDLGFIAWPFLAITRFCTDITHRR
jgi:hypothetical protein